MLNGLKQEEQEPTELPKDEAIGEVGKDVARSVYEQCSTFDLHTNESDLIPLLCARLDHLRAVGVEIQAHPLGLIRLPLRPNQQRYEPGQYLHIWIPGEFPTQEGGGPFTHTHVFNLKSRIVTLQGSFTDVQLATESDVNGTHYLVEGIASQNICHSGDIGQRVKLRELERNSYQQGDVYYVPKGQFHFTEVQGSAVTLIDKYDVDQAYPFIVVPVGSENQIEPFRTDQLDQKRAWEICNDLLRTH